MNRKLIIILAILLPLVGIGMVVAWASGARQAAYEGAELTPAVRAVKEIPKGTKVTDMESYVQVAEYPKEMLPKDYYSSVEALQEAQKDSVATRVIASGEFIVPPTLFEGAIPGAPENYEEVTLELSSARGSTNSVAAGDHVAVYVTIESEGELRRLLSDVVISQINGSSKAKANTEADSVLITFAVTEEDARKLIYSASFGEVWLSIVNPESSQEQSEVELDQPDPEATGDEVLTEEGPTAP